MSEMPMTRSTLNVKSQQKCKAKKNVFNTFHSNELSFIEQREKQQKHKKHKNTVEDISGEKNFSLFPWRLISSLLGVMCLLLMAVAVAVTISTANSTSESLNFFRRVTDIRSLGLYHPCPENWVWFRCSCYYFSKEKLSWRESQLACLSLNSSLIRISREEMDFFRLDSFFWVGVYYNGTSKEWRWENDSVLSSRTFCGFETDMQDSCASYKSKEICFLENCTNKLEYICKK
ncbi:killer cell lectin-like receptor subfamily E member 1 [Chionomys nivalis]|uniref:killer cell lectin-like receptor subfamily E member 1 n=1 Tax=Chionomys nivalis TaxID=269649 RepID=UPI00259588EB|nr:killer cell lectin-like receptor subfamily E member 1 [Chionomys nivalis]